MIAQEERNHLACVTAFMKRVLLVYLHVYMNTKPWRHYNELIGHHDSTICSTSSLCQRANTCTFLILRSRSSFSRTYLVVTSSLLANNELGSIMLCHGRPRAQRYTAQPLRSRVSPRRYSRPRACHCAPSYETLLPDQQCNSNKNYEFQ